MNVYQLTTYDYNDYSYRGIDVADIILFESEESARKYASLNNLIVVLRVPVAHGIPTEYCTIEKVEVRP